MKKRYTADPRRTPEGLLVMTEAETFPVEPAPETRDRTKITIPSLSRGEFQGAVVLGPGPEPEGMGFPSFPEPKPMLASAGESDDELEAQGFRRVAGRGPRP